MKLRSLMGLGLSLAVSVMFGCGGGGGDSALPTSTTVISGMASKGPIRTGTVKVYAIRAGVEDRSAPIGQVQTDDGGNYTVDVGSYKGPVLVEVTGGAYTDEVSGGTVALKAPLRAIVSDASTGSKKVAVTPLTELAYKKAKGGGAFTEASINSANASIAASFKLADIVSTLPVAGSSNEGEKQYAVLCGSVSQLVNDNRGADESLDDALPRLLTEMGDEMEHSGGLSNDSITKINDAITKHSGSDKNKITPTRGFLKIGTTGTTGTIGAVDVTVNLPAGVTVKADAATGEAASGAVVISGLAAVGDNRLASAKFIPASGGAPAQLRIGLINVTGFGPGEFVTVRFDLADGGSFPASPSAFFVSGFAVKGLDGTAIGGMTAAPTSMGAEI